MQLRHQRFTVLVAFLAILLTYGTATAQDHGARAGKGGKSTNGWTIGVGVGIAVVAVVASLALLSTRKRTTNDSPRQAGPAPLPTEVHDAPVTDANAICAKAPNVYARPPSIDLGPPPADGIRSGLPRPALPAALPEPAPVGGWGPTSRGPTLACGRCARAVPADLGAPPWCPHCGSDLKPAAQPGMPTVRAGELVPAALLQPPYFVGRAARSYRVYILPKQLLFLDCPAPDDRSASEKVVMGVSIQGGLIGAMIGGAIAGAIQQNRLAKTRDRDWTLNMADTDELIAMAEREQDSFALDLEDLRDVVIEGLTFWQRAFADRCAARLKFLHPVRGPLTFALPRPIDVGVAIKQLPPLLDERITVDAKWDWGKNRYVPKG
jgi:hypothetical protein